MVKTRSEQFLEQRQQPPLITPQMAKSVSQYRKETLREELEQGKYRETNSPYVYNSNESHYSRTVAGNITASSGHKGMVKTGNSGSGSWGGTSNTVRQTPDLYSPLLLDSNLQFPRDRATINAWCRAYFATNPLVQNAISLHSTYPISKLNIKCKDKKIEDFFNGMCEEIDLMNVCIQIAQEFWSLGEAFPYAELDHSMGKWSRIAIQNPDYIVVKQSVVAGEPMISLRPDENLRRICTSNRAIDVEQRQRLNRSIVEYVKRGENIPLSNFYVSHLARKISPYEVRGTGLTVSCFRALMLFDKLYEAKFAQAANMINPLTLVKIGGPEFKPSPADLEAWREMFECYDEETEVLTDQGFKKFNEVIEYTEVMDGTYGTSYITSASPKPGIKVACFDPETEELVYSEPLKAFANYYSGDMHHFFNEKMDIKVTPNHDMWVSEKEYEYNGHRSLRKEKWGEWKKVKAEELKLNGGERFRSQVNWTGKEIKSITLLGKEVPVELYLEFLGYVLSEGCLYSDGKYQHTVGVCQAKYVEQFKKCADELSKCLDKSYSSRMVSRENSLDIWNGVFCSKELYDHFKNEVQSSEGKVKCYDKQVPRWILDLSPRLLQIFLDALILGDGSTNQRKNESVKGNAYYSTSKQLADDVYEIAYKCGYVPTLFVRNDKKYLADNKKPLYTVLWSNSGKGSFPLVYKNSRNSVTKEKHDTFAIEKYNGIVWCFTTETGLFITRRNGKVTIQGNSAQYDKDFKIFTHEAVTVERVGYNSGIIDIANDITQLVKFIYIGLMVPSALMDGGSDTTYANAGVGLDVLRQRYMTFRNMLSAWLRRKIFAPISKINEFYEWKDGERKLIVPEVDWNHMSLFDAGDYIQQVSALVQTDPKAVSVQSLYRSLGLDWEDEKRKLKAEMIHEAIRNKEKEALAKLPLSELHTLEPDSEIKEPVESPLPGEQAGEEGEIPDGGDGGMPPLPGEGEEMPVPPPPPPPEG